MKNTLKLFKKYRAYLTINLLGVSIVSFIVGMVFGINTISCIVVGLGAIGSATLTMIGIKEFEEQDAISNKILDDKVDGYGKSMADDFKQPPLGA